MSFKAWFKRWVRSFHRLIRIGIKPRKSDKQRKEEHRRRMKAKYAPPNYFKKKRKYKRHAGRKTARGIAATFDFFVTSLAILFLPFGLFHWGYKSAQTRHRAKKAAQARASAKNSHRPSPAPQKANVTTPNNAQAKQSSPTVIPQASTKPKTSETKAKSPVTSTKAQEQASVTHTQTAPRPIDKPIEIPPAPPAPEAKVLDENTPKSSPKHEADRYIRKRMIIAGSSYCEPSVLTKLQVGTYFDLSREPDNPYDKDAVVLTYEDEKIGYVAKADVAPYTVSLNLRRKIYGVITDIITEGNRTKYEYETWFDSEK